MFQFAADLHIHTTLSECCHDAAQLPENIFPLLKDMGLKKAALTDHIWRNPAVPPSPWYAPQNGDGILLLRDRVKAMKNLPLSVIVGCEADMQGPGKFGVTAELREQLDIIVFATDHFHMRDPKYMLQPEAHTPEKLAPHMMAFYRSAVRSGLPDVLVHPLYPISYTDIYRETAALISDAEFRETFRETAQAGIGLEINGSVITELKKNGQTDVYARIMTLAKESGCKFTYGSDAHSLKAFEPAFTDGNEFARLIGLTDGDLHPLMFA